MRLKLRVLIAGLAASSLLGFVMVPGLIALTLRSSQDQVAAGAVVFSNVCATCHGGQAEGGEGPALEQSNLSSYRSADRLFRFVRISMPNDDPGSLSDSEYYAAVAFLLDLNGMNPDGVILDSSTAADVSLE